MDVIVVIDADLVVSKQLTSLTCTTVVAVILLTEYSYSLQTQAQWSLYFTCVKAQLIVHNDFLNFSPGANSTRPMPQKTVALSHPDGLDLIFDGTRYVSLLSMYSYHRADLIFDLTKIVVVDGGQSWTRLSSLSHDCCDLGDFLTSSRFL